MELGSILNVHGNGILICSEIRNLLMLNACKVKKMCFFKVKKSPKTCQIYLFFGAKMTFTLVSYHISSFPNVSQIFRKFKIFGSFFIPLVCTWITKFKLICNFVPKTLIFCTFFQFFLAQTVGLGSILNVHGNGILICSEIRNLLMLNAHKVHKNVFF